MAAEKTSTKQEEQSSLTALANFIWDSETKQFLGRTGISWLKVTVFYIIFYICLAAFWALMLMLFYQTIDPNYPKWQLDASRIGSNPGLGYRPRPPDSKIDSTLISFNAGANGSSWKHWVENLDEFLRPYQSDSNDTVGRGQHIVPSTQCGQPIPADKFCQFDIKQEILKTECSSSNSYGYKDGKPCVLIKLNRIYNWRPEPYTDADKPKELASNQATKDGVLIECHGENPNDIEGLGEVKYYPNQIIKSVYFPFTNQPGYLSPFVMVQFTNPKRGDLLNIECRAWAKNIKYDRSEREGSVHFELLVN